jgi:hypothetical protein
MPQPTLENVVKDLTHWRQTRDKRGPIPETLRKKISTLSSRYRTSEITAALGINTGQLKTFSEKTTKKEIPPIKFVRIGAPIKQNDSGKIACHLKRPDGATLECTLDSLALSQLMGDFLCLR